ncbi:hypothetical protein [Methylobacterium soli]|uniref:Uncharacterized protein n=1 Tax=Methylobacterium soli TaxID=553447 RepID=A0A6L3SYT3_9HYPH|nr:hypothetical protein [Methylobacterium soli]KAB1078437.1 hypothetical protein F6X53_15285 [Methylobacterium soli]GJE42159.1 hypothetical protein AEGHOMDF_1330 [Methylobacterium soli]
MIRAALALTLALVAVPAQAQRQSTTDLTCPQARAIVIRSGAVVLGTGGPTYDRFVRDRNFCEATEFTRAAFAPTRTDPRCFIGYTCYEPSADDWFSDR